MSFRKKDHPKEYHILILAAGFSSRLGQPKQLLPWKGGTLIETIIEIALDTKIDVHLALGHEGRKIQNIIDGEHVQLHTLRRYAEGMGSSLAEAVGILRKQAPEMKGLLLILSDQPFITTQHLMKLISIHRETQEHVVTEYEGQFGPPVLFDQSLFDKLTHLSGEKGAKSILIDKRIPIKKVLLKEAAIDLDTLQDYQEAKALLKHHK